MESEREVRSRGPACYWERKLVHALLGVVPMILSILYSKSKRIYLPRYWFPRVVRRWPLVGPTVPRQKNLKLYPLFPEDSFTRHPRIFELQQQRRVISPQTRNSTKDDPLPLSLSLLWYGPSSSLLCFSRKIDPFEQRRERIIWTMSHT